MHKVLKEVGMKSQQNPFFPVTARSYASFLVYHHCSMFPTVPGAVEKPRKSREGETDLRFPPPTLIMWAARECCSLARKMIEGLATGPSR